MAVKIRLRRTGKKKAPFYRIVVADSRYPRNGRFIEEIGYYNPLENPPIIKIDAEKARKWVENGAQPTDTVKALLQKAMKAEAPAAEAPQAEEAAKAEADAQ